jgi:lycopene beta-cyclase
MSGQMVDVAIVGGGLSGGLIALALNQAHPELRITLFEKGAILGGNHRWSWFESDLSKEGKALMETFRVASWDDGYEVNFPRYRRKLTTGYRSMTSRDFAAGLTRQMPEGSIRLKTEVTAMDAQGVTLASGERVPARAVIDCRAFEPNEHLEGGWQVFMGRHTRCDDLHQVERPMIMDASVEQIAPYQTGNRSNGAYRFFYVLPLGAHDVFVEDTYYCDEAKLDRSALSSRLDQYHTEAGWRGQIVGNETGVLPVITGGNFSAYQASVAIPGVAIAGSRGGFSHPLTSYTLCFALENALAIAREADLTGYQLTALMEARARQHWSRTKFYRRLARTLFGAAEPSKRVDIFSRFYRRPQGLVERFYRGASTFADKIRVLTGKPPVSPRRVIKAWLTRGEPLVASKQGRQRK